MTPMAMMMRQMPKKRGFLIGVAFCIVIMLVVTGIWMAGRVAKKAGTATATEMNAASTEAQTATMADAQTSTDLPTTEGNASDPAQPDSAATTEASAEPAATEAVTTETALPASAEQDQYYIIQEGDSLSSIAFTRYGDADLAAKIAEANDIGIDDNIFVGQKILLPNLA